MTRRPGEGRATSLRARGKIPTIQVEYPPLAEMDKELACWLQAEEVVVEKAHQGRDATTLEVLMEAAGLLMHGKLEGLGAQAGQAHPEAAGPSCLLVAVEIQLPVVVA